MACEPEFPVPETESTFYRVPGKVSIGDRAQVGMRPGLLKFLATPWPDDLGVRPGVHVHPFSGIPLGIAVHAAIEAVGGRENGIDVLRGVEASWESTIKVDEETVATAEVIETSLRCVRCKVEVQSRTDGRLLFRGVVTLVKVVDGRAVEVGEYLASV